VGEILQPRLIPIERAIGQTFDYMRDVGQHADALSRQSKMLAELRAVTLAIGTAVRPPTASVVVLVG
jgi:hypothetical protein